MNWIIAAFLRLVGPSLATLKAFVAVTVGYWAARLLMAFGLYFVVMRPLTDAAHLWMIDAFQGLPGHLVAWLGFYNVDKAFSLIVSAYAVSQVSRVVLAKRPAAT